MTNASPKVNLDHDVPASLRKVPFELNQKPIRVETCNARSQLPNIQCELIG